jgi:uncharacterized protein
MSMDLLHVEVRKTNLGNALFANKRFRTGQEIGIIEGKLIKDPDYGSEYCIALDPHTSIEPSAPFRFLNHSCEPNCELVTWVPEDSSEPRLALYALKSIKAGSELTIDYAWPADAAIHCLCGSAGCRGWVVAESELELVVKAMKKRTSKGPRGSRVPTNTCVTG